MPALDPIALFLKVVELRGVALQHMRSVNPARLSVIE